MKKIIFISLAAILILSIVLSGCSQSAISKPGGGKEGGRLQLSTAANIADIGDPTGSAGPGDAAITWLAVEPLLIIDNTGALQPWLAESFEIAADKSSMTFHLRQGISYTDGTPFNATAVKFNCDREIASEMWPNMKGWRDCVIIDDYTVKLNFAAGWDWVAAKALAGWWSALMYCPTALTNNTPEYNKTHVVGTGPFIQTGYEPNLKVTFDRNPNYWRGSPFLDGVDISVITDSNVSLMAYKTGLIDFAGIQTQDAQGVMDEGFTILKSMDMVFNMCLLPSSGNPDSILQDINIRRAVESAINKQQIVDTLTYGYGVATNQGFCLDPYMDPTTVGYPFSLTAATNYMTTAGHPDGFTTTLYMVQGGPDDVPMAIKGMLEEANITLDIQKIGYLQLVQMIGGGGTGWDGYIWMYGFPGVQVDPASTLKNGPLNAIPSTSSATGWQVTTWISCDQPAELCALALQGAQEADAAKRIPIYQQISRLTTDTYCQWSYLYYVPSLVSIAPRVKGGSYGKYTEFLWYTFAWLE